MINLLDTDIATDKSLYFAQPRIIIKYLEEEERVNQV